MKSPKLVKSMNQQITKQKYPPKNWWTLILKPYKSLKKNDLGKLVSVKSDKRLFHYITNMYSIRHAWSEQNPLLPKKITTPDRERSGYQ